VSSAWQARYIGSAELEVIVLRPIARLRTSAFLSLAAVVTCAAAGSAALEPRAPSLRQVLARAADYSVAYGSALASVVADETFVQELVLPGDGYVVRQRRLESEIAFVKLAQTTEWLAFRGVLRVDGTPAAHTAGQLERIFRYAPQSALAQARAITAGSARYNLGPVERNFNVPTTVLQFLLPQHQNRFRFRKVGEERAGDEPVWVVEFRERGRSTFIRTPEGRDAPAEGRLWIVPADGRVIRSRLVVEAGVRAEIEAAWQYDDRLQLWVPEEMREHYRGPWKTTGDLGPIGERYDVRGVARYSNYRRFEVEYRIGKP